MCANEQNFLRAFGKTFSSGPQPLIAVEAVFKEGALCQTKNKVDAAAREVAAAKVAVSKVAAGVAPVAAAIAKQNQMRASSTGSPLLLL